METRLGNILYGVGLLGAGLSVFYAIDAMWVYESGTSLLRTSGHFLSREEMLVAAAIGGVLAVLSWRAGKAARSFVNKSAEMRATAKDPSKYYK